MIFCTIKFYSKKFQNSCIPGESCFKFYMKCLNCQNFVTAHAFLTGWHLFTYFTVGPFLCTPSALLDFCFILVTSNTEFGQACLVHTGLNWKLRILFSMLQYSSERLSKFWHGNCCLAFRRKFLGFVVVCSCVVDSYSKIS